MADLWKKLCLYYMTPECYDSFYVEHNYFDGKKKFDDMLFLKSDFHNFSIKFSVDCWKMYLSKGLGINIIIGSMLVKVPQIVKILKSKSTEGISIVSVLLDLMAITFHMSYSFVKGFPFSAWGDGTFLALQTAIIGTLVFFYGYKSSLKSTLFVIIYSTITFLLMSGITPVEYLLLAQGCNVPILLMGKLSQALINYQNQSTGQLSAITCFMLLSGSLARIFTSVQETGDSMMILIYCVSSFANAVIVFQLLYYWNKPLGPAIVAKDVPAPQKSKKAKKAD